MLWRVSFLSLVACLLFVLFAWAQTADGDRGFQESRDLVVMRSIGHRILLNCGDSNSRVLPIKKISDLEFEIPFESRFSFKADSLAAIIDQEILKSELPKKYVVKVIEPASGDMMYGYVKLDKNDHIKPCGQRDQESLQYAVRIQFEKPITGISKYMYLSGLGVLSLALLMLLGFRRMKRKLPQRPVIASENISQRKQEISLGKFLFYPDIQCLVLGEEKIILSQKETRILSIFAESPNEIIDRNRIQKEVWEDEGVIVGRSLDMFISKLRKKLEADTGVRIVNIHGRGYKLEVNEQ